MMTLDFFFLFQYAGVVSIEFVEPENQFRFDVNVSADFKVKSGMQHFLLHRLQSQFAA